MLFKIIQYWKIQKEYKYLLRIIYNNQKNIFLTSHGKKEQLKIYFQNKNLAIYFSERQKNNLLNEVIKYKFSILEIFLKNGFEINEKNFYLLLKATFNNMEENALYILEKNKDLKEKNPKLFYQIIDSAIIDVIKWYNHKLFNIFMENGAHLAFTNFQLNYLMQSNQENIKKIILDLIFKYHFEFTEDNIRWLQTISKNIIINKNNQICLELLEKRKVFHRLHEELEQKSSIQLIKI